MKTENIKMSSKQRGNGDLLFNRYNFNFKMKMIMMMDLGGHKAIWMSLMLLMEKAMAPHSSTLAWKIPWTEEPGRLQTMGSRRVGHDWATSLSLSCIGEGNGNPLQCSCLENPREGGAWLGAIYGVAQSRTWLKWLSSSSSSSRIVTNCTPKMLNFILYVFYQNFYKFLF